MTFDFTSRRALLQGGLAATAAGLALGPLAARRTAAAALLPPTPSCESDPSETRATGEGPFYVADAPLKRDLRADALGQPLSLTGFVATADCRPLAGAVVDLWHADSEGHYDGDGFRLRGRQATDDKGRYRFETIVPARYPGRTRHYHIKLWQGRTERLTTQLYFPGEAGNYADVLFDRRLLMAVVSVGGSMVGRFDFVIAT